MADQHNDNIPALANQIANDIPDIKENLEYHKDVFEAFVNSWSSSTATNIKPKIIGDADNDTLIQCEESADEDIIRLDTGGTERVTLTTALLTSTLPLLFSGPQSGDPTTGANNGAIFTKDVSSKAELHFKDEDDNVIQLTSGGNINNNFATGDESVTMSASGSVSYTGYGFKPRAVIFLGGGEITTMHGFCVGFTDGTLDKCMGIKYEGGANDDLYRYIYGSYCLDLRYWDGATNYYQQATFVSFDNDGFTLSWSAQSGGLGAVTRHFYALALR